MVYYRVLMIVFKLYISVHKYIKLNRVLLVTINVKLFYLILTI